MIDNDTTHHQRPNDVEDTCYCLLSCLRISREKENKIGNVEQNLHGLLKI